MSNYKSQYRQKLSTAEELVRRFKPGDMIQLGVWYGQPYGVIAAIGEHARDVNPLYIVNAIATGSCEFFNLPNVRVLTAFFGPSERAAARDNGNVYYMPMQFTDGLRLVRDAHRYDYFVFRVAPMDENGNFNFSLTASWEYYALRWLHEHRPGTTIVLEVNPNLPRVHGLRQFGGNELNISSVDVIVEDDSPILRFPTASASKNEEAIAANVALLIEDRSTVQLGFGNIPMAIGRLLCQRKDLGIHTEMFCEAHIDMIEAGSVSNAHKGLYDGVSVATFALGTERLHAFARENPQFAILPVEEVNRADVLARVNNMVSINSALTIDLNGQVCAHCIGPRTYSGLGGAFEFAYGSQLSPGGKSVICLPSTTRLEDNRVVSNIVTNHPPGTRITVPEHVVDWVVTQFGSVRLKFMNMDERAKALIEIAHPEFREELSRQATAQGLRHESLTQLRPTPAHFFLKTALD